MNQEGYYFLSHPFTEEKTLAYLYECEDEKCLGFGFNTRDGGGFMPLSDLDAGVTWRPAKIEEK